ncbi:hypothetical protein [Brevibacillus reuszeri]|uniref:hypothetical protein n=1 Tax=Brevibacillus reuszeri TaxID=54915 RepID=UPI00289632BC|nr:hypothetical protein [Brevibacillus reuszeri]
MKKFILSLLCVAIFAKPGVSLAKEPSTVINELQGNEKVQDKETVIDKTWVNSSDLLPDSDSDNDGKITL